MLGLYIKCYSLLNLNIFSHIDYTFEDEDGMSIEIIIMTLAKVL